MQLARVFQSGNSQAVRIPRRFRFHHKEVEIFRRDNELILREPVRPAGKIAAIFSRFSKDFFVGGRRQPPAPTRRSL